ncbi:HAD superfamily hydrolase (TIGR01509 family) [Paraburkholderia sp. 40]
MSKPAYPDLKLLTVVISAAFGAAKPASQTYLRCVERLGAAVTDTLFIDDSQASVDGALAAGF